MQTNFEIGDTVQLRVGGALMCVNNLRGDPATSVNCVWHDRSTPCNEIYAVEALVRFERDVGGNA